VGSAWRSPRARAPESMQAPVCGIRMSKRLYVGNLPYSVTEQELLDAFAQWGATQAAVPINEMGRSKGFGFIEVADEHAEAAIAAMHNNMFRGRTLTVNEARPREDRRSGGGYSGGGYSGGGGEGSGSSSRAGTEGGGRFGGERQDRGGDRYERGGGRGRRDRRDDGW
jgi:RNA recognition motif-containing protein